MEQFSQPVWIHEEVRLANKADFTRAMEVLGGISGGAREWFTDRLSTKADQTIKLEELVNLLKSTLDDYLEIMPAGRKRIAEETTSRWAVIQVIRVFVLPEKSALKAVHLWLAKTQPTGSIFNS